MLGWTPHAKQELFGESTARSLYYICGIRHGKSDAAAMRFLYCMFFGAGHRYINAALTQDQANIVVERAHQIALSGPLACYVEKFVRSPFPTLILKNDARLQGRTVDDPNLLRGRPYHGAGVDEGSFAKEEAIRLLRGRTLDHNGWLAIYTTPKGRGTWLHLEYVRALQEIDRGNPGYFCATGTTWDNPHIPREAIEELKRECEAQSNMRWYQQEVLGEFVDMEGATFPQEILDRVFQSGLVCEPAPIPKHIYVTGWDIGRHAAITVGTTLNATEERLRGVDRVRLKNTPFAEQKAQIDGAARHWGAHVIMDATKGSMGVPILETIDTIAEPFEFSRQKRDGLIATLRAVCQTPDGIVLPREWTELYTQMQLHTYEEDVDGFTWDDLDSLMLAVHHARAITFRGPLLTRLM